MSSSENSGNTTEHAPAREVLYSSVYVLDAGYQRRMWRAILVNDFIQTRSMWQPVATVAVLFVAALIAYWFIGIPALPFLIVGSIGTAGLALQVLYAYLKTRSLPAQSSLVAGATFRAAFAQDRFQLQSPAGQKGMLRYTSFTGLTTRLGFVFLKRDSRRPLILPRQLFTADNLAWLENRIRDAQSQSGSVQ